MTSDRDRLRRLLEDLPRVERELATASGTETGFFVRNPPMVAAPPPVVSVDGIAKGPGTDYIISTDGITFATPPAAGAQVAIIYWRLSYTDQELDDCLEWAGLDWDNATPGAVYRAAIYAIDNLMLGAATAADFGAEGERIDFSSIFDRISKLRAEFAAELTTQAQRPMTWIPADPPETSWP